MPRRVPLIALNAALRLFHPPNIQPTRFRQLHALQAMYEETVPDSEPEREEQRRNLDEERRMKRTRKRQGSESTRSMSFVLSSSPEPVLSALFSPFLSTDDLILLSRAAVVVVVVKENPSQAVRRQKRNQHQW